MTSTVLVTLALSVPLAAVAWIGALAVDRTSAGLKVRRAVWMFAFTAPLALTPMALAARTLGWSAARPVPSTPLSAAEPVIAAAPSIPYEPPIVIAPEVDWAVILLAVIVIGAALRLVALIWHGLSLARTLRRAEPLAGDYAGMTVRLYDGESPVLAGFIKPLVLLPRSLAATLTPSQITLICAHERAHLQAGDHIANLWESFAMTLFWFNPVLGPIRAGLSAVREEACDAAALSGAERPTRRVYAEVLMSAIRHAGAAEPAVAFTGFYRARSARRLRAILTPQGKSAKTAALVAAGVGLALAGTAGGLAYAFAGAQDPAPLAATAEPVTRTQIAQLAAPATPVERAATPRLTTTAAVPATATPEPKADQEPASGMALALALAKKIETDAMADAADQETLVALNRMLVDTRMKRIEVRAQLESRNRMPSIRVWPALREDAQYKDLVKQQALRYEHLQEMRKTWSATSEPVREEQAYIDGLEQRINNRAYQIASDMEMDLESLNAREETIRKEIEAMRKQMMAQVAAR